MKEKGEHEIPDEIATLAERIKKWRQERNRKAMPRELWEEAAQLGRKFGVYPVSRDLNLHYGRLKQLVTGEVASVHRRKKATVTKGGFMELRAVSIPDGEAGTVVDSREFVTDVAVTKPGGTTLRIRQRGPEGMELSGIVAAFLGKR